MKRPMMIDATAKRKAAVLSHCSLRILRELGSDKLSKIIRFNNSNRCSEVSYVAPLSEDIDLK